MTDAEVAPLGVDTPDFVNGNKIPAGSTANFLYRVSVITTLDSGEEEIVSASSRFTLSVNMPPSSGVSVGRSVRGSARFGSGPGRSAHGGRAPPLTSRSSFPGRLSGVPLFPPRRYR